MPDAVHLLLDPHHDGSPLYVGDEAPAPGSRVTLRVRTSSARPVAGVWVRSTPDAEPHWDRAIEVSRTEDTVWWEASMAMRNPVQRYRFLVAGEDGDYLWLNGAGVFDHDVPDAFDFVLSSHEPAPDWGRDGTVYQIFPDRFARSAAAEDREVPAWAMAADWDDTVIYGPTEPGTPLQLFGGDLDGITEHLDHLARVGVDTVYLTPVFPGESNHRYNASTFDHVDPLLGGDEALVRLSDAVHARGWRLLGDLTTNHTGDTHEWFTTALADPTSPERGYYYFTEDGESYEGWLGHHTLPKLDYTSTELRRRLVEGDDSVVARWLRPPYRLDGWRIDVANMTGRRADTDLTHEVARQVRATSVAARPDALVLAEHGHDAAGDLDGDGWHGTMNYVGFSGPLWTWLRRDDQPVRAFGLPVPLPSRGGSQVVRTMRAYLGRFGWRATATSWNILGSHDSPRIRTVTGSASLHRVAAGLQFTLPGVPMVFAGDEIGLEGVLGEDSRRPMPWHREDSWDAVTLDAYAALTRLRREHPALRRGGLRWVHTGDDALVFLREHPAETLLVVASRRDAGTLTLPAGPLGLTDGAVLFSTDPEARPLGPPSYGDGPAAASYGEVSVPLGCGDGPVCTVYRV